MIIDEMVAAAPYLKRTFDQCHIVRVPYQVFPFNQHDLSIDWVDSDSIKKILPTNHDNSINVEWCKLPYSAMLVVSQNTEQGCLLALSTGKEWLSIGGLILHKGLVIPVQIVNLKIDQEVVYQHIPKTYEDLKYHLELFDEFLRGKGMSPLKGISYKPSQDLFESDLTIDTLNMAARVFVTLAIMNCSNISSQEVIHSPKIQKARIKRGNLPLYRHHILVLKQTNRKTGTSIGSGQPLASHWVRGHFKKFTEEKPLFGRITGRFWWTPHLAGQANRVVTKEYELR